MYTVFWSSLFGIQPHFHTIVECWIDPTSVLLFEKRPTPGLSYSIQFNPNIYICSYIYLNFWLFGLGLAQIWLCLFVFVTFLRLASYGTVGWIYIIYKNAWLFAALLTNLVCQQYFVGLAEMTTILWELPPIQLLHEVAQVKHCFKKTQLEKKKKKRTTK